MKLVFWISIFILIHSYLLYPGIIKIISLFFKQKKYENEPPFTISILISAYNEEKVIRERLSNIAGLDYDLTKVEVLVGSDCSSDKTDELLLELKKEYPWLYVYLFEKRRGKVSVINDLVREAKNEILLFTDANTEFDQFSAKYLVAHFNDPLVGGVCGRLRLLEYKADPEKNIEEKNYWEYETLIKKPEGKCGILIGANGGIFAIKRRLFQEIPLERPVTDDLYISLSILKQKYKFIYEPNAIAYEEVAPYLIHEFKRKIRFSATNFYTLIYFIYLLFSKNVLLSYAFWTHKVIRWLTPIFLILIFILNVFLIDQNITFKIFLLVQVIFYMLAISGFLLKKINVRISPLLMSFYFLMTNVALFIGLIKFLFGRQTAFWQSTPR